MLRSDFRETQTESVKASRDSNPEKRVTNQLSQFPLPCPGCHRVEEGWHPGLRGASTRSNSWISTTFSIISARKYMSSQPSREKIALLVALPVPNVNVLALCESVTRQQPRFHGSSRSRDVLRNLQCEEATVRSTCFDKHDLSFVGGGGIQYASHLLDHAKCLQRLHSPRVMGHTPVGRVGLDQRV
jgi:hypothetical protein